MNQRKESEAYRTETLQRLQEKNRYGKSAEVFEAEKLIAKYREEQTQIHDAIARLGSPLPEADACPECYYLHGLTIIMQSTQANITGAVFACGECGFIQHRYA